MQVGAIWLAELVEVVLLFRATASNLAEIERLTCNMHTASDPIK
jgi:hypothetical protein